MLPKNRYGIAYVPENIVERHVASGLLVQVLDDWSPFFEGYFLYYPSRRQNLLAFKSSSMRYGIGIDWDRDFPSQISWRVSEGAGASQKNLFASKPRFARTFAVSN